MKCPAVTYRHMCKFWWALHASASEQQLIYQITEANTVTHELFVASLAWIVCDMSHDILLFYNLIGLLIFWLLCKQDQESFECYQITFPVERCGQRLRLGKYFTRGWKHVFYLAINIVYQGSLQILLSGRYFDLAWERYALHEIMLDHEFMLYCSYHTIFLMYYGMPHAAFRNV